ncbi:glycoside hydrolase family 3 N-terminal domain-containing protein [Paludibaculum fermentans]|uniref:glycoside hydrolase family 3 N-terminal domain-containing protein n=1 Tax=Paludibaculum fermentans TaxID=1473598 RepID=UPI003EC001AA
MKNTSKSGSAAMPPHSKANAPAYKNPKLTPERRTKDLLGRMTLEEKAAQMICVWQKKAETLVDADGRFDPAKARAAFRKGHGLGQVGRPSDAGPGLDARRMAELTNAIQRFFVEESRLGIPVVFHEECLHGQAAVGGTSFPQPIGLGATFDPALVESLYTMTALEARSRGAHQALTPVVDVARDPRWGRVEETFGEDPFLVSRMGIAAVRGFQGDVTFRDKTRLIATLKHFAAHGQPESGMNCAPANVSERVLRETFLYPFEQAIRHGGAISVMPSYNEIDGVPSHANRWLLRDVLRKEWGFQGYTVSDYYAIWELSDRPDTHGHFLAGDKKQACALAVEAGVNIELPEPDCYLHLVELVRKGVLKEAQLDELVAPMLLWKFRLGLFDDPYVDPEFAASVAGCEAHRPVALQAARETVTLLKNEGSLLPLDAAALKTIAVIGPNGDRPLLGGYSGKPEYCSTVLEGVRARVGASVKVLYSEGCRITQPGSWNQDEVLPSDPAEDRQLIAAAVRTARKADVIILAIGGNEQTSREAWSLNHMGDRTSLDLIGRQDELVRALLALGKPIVALLFNGRPLSIREVAQSVPAILECWYLGQETGTAVAEILFGDVNPSGKLPITIPRSAGHIPAYYNHKPSARRGYLFDDVSPLFAFGFGLSYTAFEFSAPRLSKKSIRRDGSTRLSVDVTNTGTRDGTEVVQLYIRDQVSSVTRPVKELKGFQRVSLQPGETRTVHFEITPELLAFWDVNMRYTVEPGAFDLMTGNSSRDGDLRKVTLRVN